MPESKFCEILQLFLQIQTGNYGTEKTETYNAVMNHVKKTKETNPADKSNIREKNPKKK